MMKITLAATVLYFTVTSAFSAPFSLNTLKLAFAQQDSPTINSSRVFNQNRVDLKLGQLLEANGTIQPHLFADLRYTLLKKDSTSEYATFPSPNMAIDDAKFTGFGPHLGVGTFCQLNDVTGLVTEVAGAIFVGQLAMAMNTVSGQHPVSAIGIANTQTRFVPAWDAKIALSYSSNSKPHHSDLQIEAGYQVIQYSNMADISAQANDRVGLKPNNVNFAGPYLGLNIKL
jgi:hypothetical protein